MTEPKEQFADTSAKRLATIYGEALLNAAQASDSVAQVLEEIDSLIDDVFKGNPQVEALLAGAAVGRKTREEAIKKAFASRASDTFYKFLLVLNDHDRLDLLRAIRRALHELSDERLRRLRVPTPGPRSTSSATTAAIRARICGGRSRASSSKRRSGGTSM